MERLTFPRPGPADPGRSAPLSWLPAAVGCALLAASLWAPFGLATIGTYEEWFVLSGYVPTSVARPLFWLPFQAAYLLGPRPFVGLNVLHAALLAAKGFVAFLLLRRLAPGWPGLALVGGVLFVVYPSDTAILSLRTTNVHAAVVLCVLAVLLLVVVSQRFRGLTLAAMVLAEALSLGIYEASLPILLVAPLLLPALPEKPRPSRFVLLAWYAPPVVSAALLARALADPVAYQSRLLAEANLGGSLREVGGQVARALLHLLRTHLVTGWGDAVGRVPAASPDTAVAVAVGVLLAAAAWLADRAAGADGRLSPERAAALLAVGLAGILVGFAAFVPTVWRLTTWRVFLYSSFGAAVTVATAVGILAAPWRRWRRPVFLLLSAAVLTVATGRALDLQRREVEVARGQAAVAGGIARHAARIRPGSVVVVLDRRAEADGPWSRCTLASDCLTNVLRYVYEDTGFDAVVCFAEPDASGPFAEACAFTPDALTVAYRSRADQADVRRSYPVDAVVAFERAAEGGMRLVEAARARDGAAVTAYRPRARFEPGPVPPRARRVFPE